MTTTKKTNVDLDLDALAPADIAINYKGKHIKVLPLELEQFAKYYDLAEIMSKASTKTNTKELIADLKQVTEFVKEVIPELKDEHLNQVQVTALFSLLGDLNSTQDKALAELKKRGIELKKGAQKKPTPRKASTS